MDKFVMMKKMNGARVRTKDLWGVQIHGGKYYIYCNRKPICYGAMRPGLTPSEILKHLLEQCDPLLHSHSLHIIFPGRFSMVSLPLQILVPPVV